jgi:tRNA threonylcarbamoyladenosine biosynthesis protein TsaB
VHSLFLDSTSGLIVGLMDFQFNWIEYKSLDEKKPSEIIHFEIYSLVKKHNLELKDMRLFISSGPGSYTGMRLSEGLAQVFELSFIPVFSFYHFDIPKYCGIANGFWVTNAFKGQLFFYNWTHESEEKILADKSNFTEELRLLKTDKDGFTLDHLSDPLFSGLSTTKDLIKEQSTKIFSHILSLNLRVTPYYFRTLDEEFR